MKKSILLFSTLSLAALTGCQREGALSIKEMVQSTRDHYFEHIEPTLANEPTASIEIDINQTAQTLKGFGTCFNELAWASLGDLSESELQHIFSELFEPGKGANLNRGRMSIGANDFALDYYSCDETDGDFELRDFSIERDKQTLLPMMHWAMRYNPEIYWFASPWCPPRWMKKTKHYAERAVDKQMVERMLKAMAAAKDAAANGPKPGEEGGVSATAGFFNDGPLAFRSMPTENDAIVGEEGFEGTTSFNMDPRYVDAYGRYFGKFVDAYKAEGVNLSMVMPQNEMNSNQNFPSCCWTSEDLATFIGQSLGPEMQKRGVEVYFGTCERPNPLLVDTILTDVECQKYVTGVAFQWAGKDALPTIAHNYPQMDLVMSEQECGNGKNNWEGAMHSWDLQRHYLSNGVTQYYYWNTSLWYDKPSRWGWYQNSLITVNADDKSWTWTPEYYELKHLSHYALPGAKRLVLGGSYEDVLGFINPDGSIVLAICNQTDSDEVVALQLEGQQLNVKMAAHSLNTVKL